MPEIEIHPDMLRRDALSAQSLAISQRTVRAQREFMRHLRACPDCDTHGKRCVEAQEMAIVIIEIVQQESEP